MKRTFPILQTTRLVLREVTLDDQNELSEILQYRSSQEPADAVKILQKLEVDFEQGRAINWGLYLNSILIGTCGYYRGFAERTGEIGFVLRAAFRSKGYMQEAVQAIVDYGFTTLQLDRIIALTQPKNTPALRLLERAGFERILEKQENYVTLERLHASKS